MYIHLHGHSHYSLLEAIGQPKDIVREAKDYEMTAIALTDYNGLYGAIEFYSACKKAEIKPIIWVELWLVPDASVRKKDEHSWNIVLIAKDEEWYATLLKLTSESHLHGWNINKARIDMKMLTHYHTWLIALMWWPGSSLAEAILSGWEASAIEHITQISDLLWKENTILELCVQDENKYSNIKTINRQVEKLRTHLELTCVCSNNYHYIDQTDQEVFEVALNIKDGKRMFDEDRRKVTLEQYIMNEDDIRNQLESNWYEASLIEELIWNTQLVADRCNVNIPMWTILFPKYESPDQIKDLYEKHKGEMIEE